MKFYQSNEAVSDNFDVLDVYMRPDNTFIQGLYYDPATKLYWEGSGLWGESKVRYLKLDSQSKQLNYDNSVPQWNMDRSIFGEGICPLNDHDIAVLTWQSDIIYFLSQDTLKLKHQTSFFDGMREGWGITNFVQDGDHKNFGLYVSDGSSNIQVVDGDTYETIRTIAVRDEQGREVKNLNELEYAKGLIWANIWYSNDIIGINPTTGKVEKRYNMSSLRKAESEYQKT